MKYAVSYCLIDHRVGGHLMWHSCILLSQLDEELNAWRVMDTWGFYGLPTSQRDGLIVRIFKLVTGLHVDLQGNHGVLCPEKLHLLDRGHGLQGLSFELDLAQYRQLADKCRRRFNEQEDAIREAAADLELVPATTFKRYPFERDSRAIFDWEKAHHSPPRLPDYTLNVAPGFFGPDLSGSHTCKTQALALLNGILTPAQLDRISFYSQVIPRLGWSLDSIYLYTSGGTPSQHRRASGKVVSWRDGSNLFWTIPPLETDTPALQRAKDAVSKLQQMEWLFRDAVLPAENEEERTTLIDQIIKMYSRFSIIKNTQSTCFFGFYLTWQPDKEQVLADNIRHAEQLIHTITSAIENDEMPDCKASLIHGLPDTDKQSLCDILHCQIFKDLDLQTGLSCSEP